MQKYLAEFVGTATLVLIGCGSATVGTFGSVLGTGQPLSALAIMPIAFCFGFAVIAMAYAIGPISGCHINPAVTMGVWASGRMPTSEVPGYVVAQALGGLAGAGLLLAILSGRPMGYEVSTAGLGQNGFGVGYQGGYGLVTAALVEFAATFIFVVTILGATSRVGATAVAGLAIGFTLVAIHIVFINVTGVSVNPARSLGPALFVGGQALSQVWLFLLVPTLAGLLAGALFRVGAFEPRTAPVV